MLASRLSSSKHDQLWAERKNRFIVPVKTLMINFGLCESSDFGKTPVAKYQQLLGEQNVSLGLDVFYQSVKKKQVTSQFSNLFMAQSSVCTN